MTTTKALLETLVMLYSPKQKTRVRPTVDCSNSENLTKQSFKDECDINNVVDRFVQTGQLPFNVRIGGVFEEAPSMSLKEALDIARGAQSDWDNLSDEVRQSFDNQFENYVDFMQNYEEVEYGDGSEFTDENPLNSTPSEKKNEATDVGASDSAVNST